MKIKHGIILVLLFLIGFVWFGSARAEGQVEIGPSQVGSDVSTGVILTMSERVNDRFDFTIGYISEQEWKDWTIREQIFVGAEYLATDPWTGKVKLGIGPYWFQNPDRIGTSSFRMGLSLEYRFNRRFGLRARHWSTAGSGPEITVCNNLGDCMTNDWNTGQDSWLRVVWYF